MMTNKEVESVPVIRYPRFEDLYEDILDCQALTLASGEPHCMALEGDTGVGKTTLVRAFVNQSVRERSRGNYISRAIHVVTPSSRHSGAIAAAILEQLGDPYPSMGRVWEQKHRIINFIRDLNVDTVVFDEFHHLWAGKNDKEVREMSDYIKVLIKETGKTFVVVGITDQISRILDINAQLSRLFAVRETLTAFSCQGKGKARFSEFLGHVEIVIEMKLDEAEDKRPLVHDIYSATKGVVGNVMNLMRVSARYASKDGSEVITRPHLRRAYDKRLSKQKVLQGNPNPF